MARPFGSNHKHVDSGGCDDSLEMNIEPVAERQVVAVLKPWSYFALVGIALEFIREQDHNYVGDGCRFGGFSHFKAGVFRLRPRTASAPQTNHNIDARVAQVVSMRMSLTAVTKHANFLALQNIQIRIAVVVNLHELDSPMNFSLVTMPIGLC